MSKSKILWNMKITCIFLLAILDKCTSTNQIEIFEYNQENYCPDLYEPIIINTTSTFDEITLCTKFSLKYLKETYFMELRTTTGNLVLLGVYFMNFEKKFGFICYHDWFYMFKWSNQSMKPDIWQKICISVSNAQILLALNGDAILNDTITVSNRTNNEYKQANLRLGGYVNEDNGDGNPRTFVGFITEVNLWNQNLELSDLISMTNSCSLIDSVPDLFSWEGNSYKVKLI